MKCATRDQRRLLTKSHSNGPRQPRKYPAARRQRCPRSLQWVRVDIAPRIEDEMLYIFFLAFFLVQFLVILGVVLFVILFSRPEVPLKGNGGLERIDVGDGNGSSLRRRETEPLARKNVASRDSQARMSRLTAVRPTVFATLSFPSGMGSYRNAARRPTWLANN